MNKEAQPRGPWNWLTLIAVIGVHGLFGNSHVVRAIERHHADPEHPAHAYWDRPLTDPFTKLMPQLRSGEIALDQSSDKQFVTSLLEALEIPPSSQLLVFSATSLQQPRISPRNPRALYFNENLYVGWVPGGQIEIVSIDPQLGGIFYIFDIPERSQPLRIERSERCMNCHARNLTGRTPGLTIKSVIPGPNSGSLDAFRLETTGHAVPFEERFGGWHVSGRHRIQKHLGNLTGYFKNGELLTKPNPMGERFDVKDYPVPTSDILAHVIFEHEIGFNNRAIELTYLARALAHESGDSLTEEQEIELSTLTRDFVRYLFFVDEVGLPEGGIEGDPAYRRAFLSRRVPTADGRSLRDLDLKAQIFQYRCSYMVHSVAFDGFAPTLKARVLEEMGRALQEGAPGYEHLSPSEKADIHAILMETLPAYAEKQP